jgi:hypothetical protein
MEKKTFKNLNRGDKIYMILLKDSQLAENDNMPIKELTFDYIGKNSDVGVYRMLVTTEEQITFPTTPDSPFHISFIDPSNQTNLGFKIFATTKKTAIEESLKLIKSKIESLAELKKLITKSEINLLIAQAVLKSANTEEELEISESFAEMALC